MVSIEQQIWDQASKNPDKLAVVCGRSQVTYSRLLEGILSAKVLYENSDGYKSGANVILAANKGVEFIYAYFGAHLAGLTVVPLDVECNPTRLGYIIDSISPVFICGFDKTETSVSKIPLKQFGEIATIKPQTPAFPDLEACADILFTTGTTGAPKGVPLTFRNEAAAARNINEFIGNSSSDVELLALPISHSFGLGRVRCCLANGQTIHLLGSFVNIKRLFRIIKEENISGFSMVPASWKFLQKMSGDELGEVGCNLKYVEMGSAYLSVEDKRHLAKLLPATKICMHYGLTEASRSAFMEFHADSDCLSTVGVASPHTEIAIFDNEGKRLCPGENGEICVKGEHVTSGYIQSQDNDSFYGDFFRTGDYGSIDDNGYVTLTARIKEIINVGGKKVAPTEVEEQILNIPGVADCACVGIKDSEGVLGEVVKAFIVRADGAMSAEQINEFLAGKLESYKIPVSYSWVDSIPKTQNGKILRSQLKDND